MAKRILILISLILIISIGFSLETYSANPRNSLPILVKQSDLILIAEVTSINNYIELTPLKKIKGKWDIEKKVNVDILNITGHTPKYRLGDTILVFLYKIDKIKIKGEKNKLQLFSTAQLNHGVKVIAKEDIDLYEKIILRYIYLSKIADKSTRILETNSWMLDCIKKKSTNWIIADIAPRLFWEYYKLLKIDGRRYIDSFTSDKRDSIYLIITTTDLLTLEQLNIMHLLGETYHTELTEFLLNQLKSKYQDNNYILFSILNKLKLFVIDENKKLIEKYIRQFNEVFLSNESETMKNNKYRKIVQSLILEM